VATLNKDPLYARAFEEVFGSAEVTAARMGKAMEQFLLTLVSGDSRFDRAVRGERVLTPEEAEGRRLFTETPVSGGLGCAQCHGGPLLARHGFANNGLERSFAADPGLGGVTGREEDRGKFAIPSLRNVAVTAPYMHDGRFASLEAVMQHYREGIQPSPTLDSRLRPHLGEGEAFSAAEAKALVAFLQTLTDRPFIGEGGH
jgi:cytochrome c peroxidase